MGIKQNKKIAVGCDIVSLARFKKAMALGGQVFLERIFTARELEDKDSAHLAGIFSAKESVIKALQLKRGNWLKMEVVYQKSGKPILKFKNLKNFKMKTADLSISHDGDYATSIFVAILK